MKKLSIFLVHVLVFVLLFSGCSNGGSKNSDAGNSNESSKSEEQVKKGEGKSSEGKVTLQFMGWEASPLETESVKKGLETFMSSNPNIKVEYTPVPNAQYASKLLTMMAGGAAPDVFFCGTDTYRAFQSKGELLDLTAYFDSEYKIDDFIPSAVEIMRINGRIYGVSSCTVSPVLYYNKEIFDKAGLPYPPSNPDKAWSWEEFVNVAKKLTIKDGDKTTQFGVYGLENFYMTTAAILSNGGKVFNNDISKCALNTSETKQVLQAILDLRKKEGVSPEAMFLEQIGMKGSQMLQTGKIGMLIDGSWALQELAQMKFPVGVGVLPKFKDAVTHGQAHVHAAWAKTPNPKEAWALISFLSSEKYQTDLIRAGLWMPNRRSLYTEEGITKWYNKDAHPEGFKELVPYFEKAQVYPQALNYKNKVNDIINDELEAFWYDNQPIDQVLARIEQKVNEELASK
ncbi:MAG: multiple sugar transport system substrate-binding protein [Petroclostridium sp.]|jgi:multiple sugar transport system substrate-binding protein|nr:Extracellular solute-binding protein family 1 [Clostridia bacterium]MDK2809599.1 multiple sugar transport system substrate-binding protein [Petroclostridium sp.]